MINELLKILSKQNFNNSFLHLDECLTLYNKFIDVNLSPYDIFNSIATQILKAEKSVDFTFFVWDYKSDPGKIIKNALQNNPNKLRVRIVLGEASYMKNKVLNELVKTVEDWNLQNHTFELYVIPYSGLGLWHTKFVNIDTSISIITGANAQKWFDWSTENSPNWSDISVSIEGEIATRVNIYFENMLRVSKKINCFDLNNLENSFDFLDINLPVLSDIPMCNLQKTEPKLDLEPVSSAENYSVQSVRSILPILILPKIANEKILLTEKDWISAYNNIADYGIITALLLAKSQILILTPNLNDLMILSVLQDISHTGKVKIQILTSYNFNYILSEIFQGGSNTNVYNDLISCCDKCYNNYLNKNFKFRYYSLDKVYPVSDHSKYVNHGKAIFIDDKTAIIASQNMDQQSFLHSAELNVLIEDSEIYKILKKKIWNTAWSNGIEV